MNGQIGWILSLEREGGLSVDPSETWIHEKEILCNIRPEDTYRRITKLSLKTTG